MVRMLGVAEGNMHSGADMNEYLRSADDMVALLLPKWLLPAVMRGLL